MIQAITAEMSPTTTSVSSVYFDRLSQKLLSFESWNVKLGSSLELGCGCSYPMAADHNFELTCSVLHSSGMIELDAIAASMMSSRQMDV